MTATTPPGPVIVAARRSPIGTAGRALAAVPASDLAAAVLTTVRDDVGAQGETCEIAEVVLGNCMGPGGNLARVAALQSGLSVRVPALTVDRQCGSGLAAITLAGTMLGENSGTVLAGGVESASTAPWRFWPPRPGAAPVRYLRAPFAPAGMGDPEMGEAADRLAAAAGISRCEQDDYAARSHQRAVATQAEGGFGAEIVPVAGVLRDERPRARFTPARLARFPPAFVADGTVTAGNSCGINDGAAVVAVMDAASHRRTGLPGLRVLATATAGVDPRLPGSGMVPAIQAALRRANLTLDDLDVIELNEAFAGQLLACCRALGLDPERVCTQGGALALGHPWGASGAVLIVRLFSQMIRQGMGSRGLAAIAIGGGQGVAVVVETCG